MRGVARVRVVVVAGAMLLFAVAAAAEETAAEAAAAKEAAEAGVSVLAQAEPDTVTVGGRFRYRVEVAAPPGVEVVLAQPAERIGDFDIIDFGDEPPAQRDGKTVVTRWYQLVGYSPGYKLLESPPVLFRRPGGELTAAPAKEIVVTIESLLGKAGDASDIRDIKGPEEVPVDWRPYALAAGVPVLLLALAVVLYRILNRPRRAATTPPKPAHVIAREALEVLRSRKLIEVGAFKEYYSGLSAIVRAYLERRFDVRAPEMTTEEFLVTTARNPRLQSGHRALLGAFLTEADLVKFARHLPTIADSERAYAAAQRFVDETVLLDVDGGPAAVQAAAEPTHAASRERFRAAG